MKVPPSVQPRPTNPIKWQLLEADPATGYDRLVVKAPGETDRDFAAFSGPPPSAAQHPDGRHISRALVK